MNSRTRSNECGPRRRATHTGTLSRELQTLKAEFFRALWRIRSGIRLLEVLASSGAHNVQALAAEAVDRTNRLCRSNWGGCVYQRHRDRGTRRRLASPTRSPTR